MSIFVSQKELAGGRVVSAIFYEYGGNYQDFCEMNDDELLKSDALKLALPVYATVQEVIPEDNRIVIDYFYGKTIGEITIIKQRERTAKK